MVDQYPSAQQETRRGSEMERGVEGGVLLVQIKQLRSEGLVYSRASCFGVRAEADEEQEHVGPTAIHRRLRAVYRRTDLVHHALFQVVLSVRVSSVDHEFFEKLFEFLPGGVVKWSGFVNQSVSPAGVHAPELFIVVVELQGGVLATTLEGPFELARGYEPHED